MKTSTGRHESSGIGRRGFLGAMGTLAAAVSGKPSATIAGRTGTLPDPDLIVLDKRFNKYKIGNTPIQRLYTGALWAEGLRGTASAGTSSGAISPTTGNCAGSRMMATWSVYRNPSGYSNGNTFDWKGASFPASTAIWRVVRYEHNGSVSVIADKFKRQSAQRPQRYRGASGRRYLVHGPGYGSLMDYEGHKGELLIKEAVYRVDGKTGQMTMVTDESASPTASVSHRITRKSYICDTGATHFPDAPKNIKVFECRRRKALRNGRQYGLHGACGKRRGFSGWNSGRIRMAIIWVGAGWVGAGYDGVHVFTPEGERIGMILLPEICANVSFGGPKRNRLFMVAGQSLYAVYVKPAAPTFARDVEDPVPNFPGTDLRTIFSERETMFCTRCGLELQNDAAYCSRCGLATGAPAAQRVWTPHRLSRPCTTKDRRVCAGFGAILEWMSR